MIKNVISVSGFGWSGSGAVVDLLREYDDIDIVDNNGNDFEFSLLSNIYDLDHSINVRQCRISCSEALIKFREDIEFYSNKLGYNSVFNGKFIELTNQYLDSIIEYSFYAWTFRDIRYPLPENRWKQQYNWFVDHIFGNRITNKIPKSVWLRNKLLVKVSHKIEIAYKPDNFDEKTKDYIRKILLIKQKKSENPIVIDQGFSPDNPFLFFKYVDSPKCIIVRRDPRDTYLLAKKAIKYMSVPLPVYNVKDYVTFYRRVIQETRVPDSETILSINFEDLVLDYESTVKKIEQFLDIKAHVRLKKKFDPKVSINNLNISERYPECAQDIKYIEVELSKYLYPFDKFKIEKNSNDIF